MSFWSVLWYIIIVFAFVAYLIILFQIIGDLFRDHGTNGFVKAIWIFFLIVAPFITALIYLIARGKGMAERGVKAATEMQAAQDAYIRQAEFDAIKAKAIA